MLLYSFIRNDRTLAIHESLTKALAQMAGHAQFRVNKEGARVVTHSSFTPPEREPGAVSRVGGSETRPVLAAADPIECCLSEVVLLERDHTRTVYRVCSRVVVPA